jgi:hypothetical protein
MDRGSVWRDPRKLPAPIPDAGIFDSPTVRICVNSKWVSHIDGLLGRLLEPDAWIGTETEVEGAIQEVLKLHAVLDYIASCSMCDDLEFQIVEGILQFNCNDEGWQSIGNVVGAQGPQGEPGAPGANGTTPILPKRAVMWHEESIVAAGAALVTVINTSQEYNILVRQSAAANGDAFTNSFWIRAGTYTLYILGQTFSDGGKIDWSIDGAGVASGQDWYSAIQTANVIKTVTGIVLTDGYHKLTGTLNGKNATSTSYFMRFTKFWLVPASD